MATKDTVSAIYDNIKTVVKTVGTLRNAREATRENSAPMLGNPVFLVSFKGSAFENITGERPAYDESMFDVIARFTHGTLDEAYKSQIETMHGIKEALTVTALNIDALSINKLVSRVTASTPELEFNAPETMIKMSFKVRYREG